MVLIFNDDTWLVVTSQWSFGNDPSSAAETILGYTWGNPGEPSTEWQVTIKMSPEDLLAYVKAHWDNGTCDLRPLQS